ncbi:MAG TPA: FAD-dependent oxidoreductase, partial [Nannocystis sp.]
REVSLASGARLRGRFVVVALGSLLAPPPGMLGHAHLLGYKFAHELVAAQRKLWDRLERPGAPHVVVIGGGISGVELAGDLAKLSKQSPPGQGLTVTLVDGGDRLLRGLSDRAGRMAARQLERQGVHLRLRTRVLEVGVDSMRLHTADGEPDALRHDGAFWAGGIRAAPVLAQLGLPTIRGYLAVAPTLQCGGAPQVFACGDAARVVDDHGEWPTMQRAIECIWEAGVVARNILALAAAEDRAPVLRRLKLRRDFPHGVSIGAASMIVYGWLAVELGFFGVWFRRFLMQMYFRRYGAPGGSGPARRPAVANADADAAAAPGA